MDLRLQWNSGIIDLSHQGTQMTKADYFKARRLIRDNGYFALKWLRMREASVMLQLRYQRVDQLALKGN